MQVFKFGGASVKDAAGVINLAEIIKLYPQEQLLVVVSAMGKTTNALEKLTDAYVTQAGNTTALFQEIKDYHLNIVSELFADLHPVFDELENTFVEIDWMLEDEPHDDYDFIYDQLVSIGELLSTRIVNAYLNQSGITSRWMDVRGYVHTDNTYREGVVDWDKTCTSIQQDIPAMLEQGVVVTQGFLGGTSENFTTTLGREGSDYTASIFAACLQASAVTTWKDVPGVLNADPKYFSDTIKFDALSYNEAIEMTYYGATIIHPKTIKPLSDAGIPLLVKSFAQPTELGTRIEGNQYIKFEKPVIILKQNQVLLSITARNQAFVSEQHLSTLTGLLAKHHLKINALQLSALSISVCFDDHATRLKALLNDLQIDFNCRYNQSLQLITLRHYQPETLTQFTSGKTVLLEQLSRSTAQMVLK
ncbi:aspartate kinase [Mucilaginibacter koreensis]